MTGGSKIIERFPRPLSGNNKQKRSALQHGHRLSDWVEFEISSLDTVLISTCRKDRMSA